MSMGNKRNAATGDAFKVHSEAAGRTRRRSPHPAGQLTVTHLHPLAAELALWLAHGNRHRWVVLDASTVVVLNHPREVTR